METPEATAPTPYSLSRFHETSAKFQRYKVLLRRRWWFLLITGAAGVCVQALMIAGKRTEYEADGKIMAGMEVQLSDKGVGLENRFMEQFYGTQIGIIQSARVRNNALDRVRGLYPGLKESDVDLRVTQNKGSSILNLAGVGEDRKFTRAYVEAILDEYIAMRKELFNEQVNGAANKVIQEVLDREKGVAAAKKNYEDFLKNNDQTLFSDSKNQAAAYLATLKNTLSVLETERTFMEKLGQDDYLRQKSQGGMGPVGTNTQITKGTGDSPTIDIGASSGLSIGGISRIEADWLGAQSELRSLEAERERLLKDNYLPQHPAIKELDNKIAGQKTRLETLKTQAGEEWDRRVKSLDLRMETVKGEIKVWEVKAREANEKIVTHMALKSEYQRTMEDYQDWKKRLEQLNTLGITVGQPASILERPMDAYEIQPQLWLPLLLGMLVGLAAGSVILLLFDRLDDRMNSFSEFQALFPNESILGQIPELSGSGDVSLIHPNDDRHLYAESFRNLRSSILFKNWRGGKPPKIILVTSAVPNEGKTTTVSNMAVTMALGGARVLLVDADLRRGGIHELFKMTAEPGLSEVLSAKSKWRDVVKDTKTKGLQVIPRGVALDQTSELFLSPQAAEMLQEMGKEYDYVIFDSAPVLVADDTASFAPKVDTVLFIVRMSSTMARLTAKALDLLYERQVNVGGVILNRSSSNLKEYTYYNYASYYSVGARKDGGKGPEA